MKCLPGELGPVLVRIAKVRLFLIAKSWKVTLHKIGEIIFKCLWFYFKQKVKSKGKQNGVLDV